MSNLFVLFLLINLTLIFGLLNANGEGGVYDVNVELQLLVFSVFTNKNYKIIKIILKLSTFKL